MKHYITALKFLTLFVLMTCGFTLGSYVRKEKHFMREKHEWKSRANHKTTTISIPKDPFIANAINLLEMKSHTFLGAEKGATSFHLKDTVKMGVELELQTYMYQIPASNSGFIDHICLFESEKKKDNSPHWYLEVDGSGSLEFVSNNFFLPTEAETFSTCLSEMNSVMKNLIDSASKNNLWKLIYHKLLQ